LHPVADAVQALVAPGAGDLFDGRHHALLCEVVVARTPYPERRRADTRGRSPVRDGLRPRPRRRARPPVGGGYRVAGVELGHRAEHVIVGAGRPTMRRWAGSPSSRPTSSYWIRSPQSTTSNSGRTPRQWRVDHWTAAVVTRGEGSADDQMRR
jgi:hypothetical protein